MDVSEFVFDLKKIHPDRQQEILAEMRSVDAQVFPDSSDQEFMSFVEDSAAVAIYVIQYHCRGRLVGQNVMPVLKLELDSRPVFVVSFRAGLLSEFRGGSRTVQTAFKVIMNHRLLHPFIPYWFVTTLNQPKIYQLFASRSAQFYPRKDKTSPEEHIQLLNMIAERKTSVEKRGSDIFIAEHNLPLISGQELMDSRIPSDSHSDFFMEHAPDWFNGKGIMCVCKLDGKMLTETAYNIVVNRKLNSHTRADFLR